MRRLTKHFHAFPVDLIPRPVLEFEPEELALVPPDCGSDCHLRAAVFRQCQCQFVPGGQGKVADHSRSDAGKISDPSGSGLLPSGQLTMKGDNHVLARNPPLFVEVCKDGFHDPPRWYGGSC